MLAHGRCIRSELAFDDLPSTAGDSEEISVRIERVEHIEEDAGERYSLGAAQGRTLRITTHDECVTMQIDRILSLRMRFAAREITCFAVSEVSEQALRYWILHLALPFFLLLEGRIELLHGMAVSSFSGAGSMAFLGPSHAGKSTLLHYFLSRGHALVTDDRLVISRQDYTTAYPSVGYYRPYRALEDLGVLAERYTPEPTALERIYLLHPVPADEDVRIEPIIGLEAITTLSSYALCTFSGVARPGQTSLAEERFRGLADMARRIPMARLHVPRSLDRLPEVYACLEADFAR